MNIDDFIIIKNSISKYFGYIGRIMEINENQKYKIRLCSSDINIILNKDDIINFFEKDN
jgi:predicted ribosome-associated RNA-binding protein Tma20